VRLGRIASIVIISTGVAAPAPGPAADTVRALFDHGSASSGVGNMRAAKADDSASVKRTPRLAATVPVSLTVGAPVAPEPAVKPPSNSDAQLRRSVEDRSVERQPAEPKGAAATAGKGTVQLGAFTS